MKKLVVFDLDDTLYYEIEFVKSAFKYIANYLDKNNSKLYTEMISNFHANKDVFEILTIKYNIKKAILINIYRNYLPPELPSQIDLPNFLINLKCKKIILGIISDGRSITQRNKLKALKIENFFDKIIISEEFGSEKPTINNYKAFDCFEINSKFYIGDNTSKDFISANKLGWTTVCLLNIGQNIHPQDFNLASDYLPKYKINNLLDINLFI